MVQWIRRCYCKHDFMLVKRNEYSDGTTTTYMCTE